MIPKLIGGSVLSIALSLGLSSTAVACFNEVIHTSGDCVDIAYICSYHANGTGGLYVVSTQWACYA
jgi:hypothetical protein